MPDDVVDYLIVGAGPAGLQLGYCLNRAGRDYLVLEAGEAPGTFFRTFPRHRQLISNNKKYTGWTDPERNLRMDWNSLLSDDPELLFTRYSDEFFPPADLMPQYLSDFAEAHRLNIRYRSRVSQVTRDGDFRVSVADGTEYRARRLIMATGVTKPYLPDIPGIELAEQYGTVSVDPQDFINQRVLVLGKGNSAFETAENLIATAAVVHVVGPDSVHLAWRTHYVGHLRAVNNNLLDAYQLKSQHAVLDGNVVGIQRDGDRYQATVSFVRANEVTKDIPYDRIIVCTGFRFDASIFAPECRPEMTVRERFPAQTAAYASTTVPDLYFAGTITQVRDFKRGTSGFIHGFRYGARALHRILEHRYEKQEWPHRTVSTEPAALTQAAIERVNRTSALWQQFGTLCDLLVVDGGEARYYEELPIDYVHDEFAPPGDAFLITLEYGPDHDQVDPFDVTVNRITQTDAANAGSGQYLHPVVRHYRGGEFVAEHHVTENLENEWDSPAVHCGPLTDFLAGQLGMAPAPVV